MCISTVVRSRPAGGTLYQYEGGNPGAVIATDDAVVTDPGHRVIFVPE